MVCVVVATTTLQNFVMHQFQSLPWRSFTWWLHTPGFDPWARVSLYIHLAYLLHSSHYMLMSKSWLRSCSGYAQSLFFVCVFCVHYESICHTHTWSHNHYRTSVVLIMNDQSRVSRLSLALSANHVELVCVDGSVVSSSSHASVCSYDHLCIFFPFTHLVIFTEVLMTKILTNNRTITLLSTWSTVN